MNDNLLLWLPILLPVVAGLIVLAGRRAGGRFPECVTLAATVANLGVAIAGFMLCVRGQEATFSANWGGFGIDFILRLYHFSGFVLLASAGFSLAVALYCWRFMEARPNKNLFYAFLLISMTMVNGAMLADHLVVMLFFWEGLLLTLFGIIAIGSREAFRTATKAFIIVGVSDLCLMLGIALVYHKAETLQISQIHLGVDSGVACAAFILLMIGAISKAGSMPFHSWIPDAALDAPLPFMAFLPASLEKLLGIYFLSRISLDMFSLTAHSWLSPLMMTVGSITILLAVMMALVQKDYKKLLSYHAISQVGYMIMGIGTAVPVGIVGGIFHMINHALYKSGLFLTAGAVEKQAGTTDLRKLGGLARNMPITFACFLVTAASISGVPPFNGFFSKELVYDGALERHVIFYLAAILGSFFTAASFLKLGHAAYLGERDKANEGVKEAPLSMLIPMVVIAGFCVLFGVCNWLPLNHLIVPIIGATAAGHHFAGMPENALLIAGTVVVLLCALGNHILGVRASGNGLGASDHIHHAPGLQGLYDKAERGTFDPFNVGTRLAGWFARVAWWVDRGIDWLYNGLAVLLSVGSARRLQAVHNGDYARYVLWSLVGALAILLFMVISGG